VGDCEDCDWNRAAAGHHTVDEGGGVLPEARDARRHQAAEHQRDHAGGEPDCGQQAEEDRFPLDAASELPSLSAAPSQASGVGGGYCERTKRSHIRSVISPCIPITILAEGVTL
jgi:hypothetical protein